MPNQTDDPAISSPVSVSPWVLVVDDEAPIRNLLSDALEPDGLEVVQAESGAAALKILGGRTREPLLVISDVLMPDMDGLTFVRKIQGRMTRGSIVLMSGHLTDLSWWPADLREVMFVAKPFRIDEINGFIRAARLKYGRQV